MKVKLKVAQSCLTLCNPMDYSPWNSPGQNTEIGSLYLLQGIFLTKGLNPRLLLGRQILYHKATWEAPGPTIMTSLKEPVSK